MRFTALIAAISTAVRTGAFRSRKKREQCGLSCGAGVERPASSIVLNNPCLVKYLLDFVGPGQHLYVSTINKLVRQCYGTVPAMELQAYRVLGTEWTKATVTHQETLCREMCASKSRLLLAVECRVKQPLQRSMLQRAGNVLVTAGGYDYRRRFLTADPINLLWVYNLSISVGRYADRALLTFAYEKLCLSDFSEYVTLGAIMSGDLDKLQWLCLVKKAHMFRKSSLMAARFGHVNILERFYQIKFHIDATTCCEAAEQGQLAVLQLLHANAHEWHEKTYLQAVKAGRLNVVQWLSEHGCTYDVGTMTITAAYCGHISILDWLLDQNDTQLDADHMHIAAVGGQLLMCQHLRSIGCAWDTHACSSAAVYGHQDVLQYLHENDCPLDIQTCVSAGIGGDIQVIKYVIESGLLSTQGGAVCTFFYAGAFDHLAAVQWLRQQGIPWPYKLKKCVMMILFTNGQEKC
jgi:hypothetical protein